MARTSPVTSAAEVDTYLHMSDVSSHVTEFWYQLQQQLPKTADLAKKLFSIPATSTASERIFSVCGTVITERRCRLSTSSLEKLVFIKYNMK